MIHINIPNPNAINQSPVAFNNQVYNNDLLSFATFLIIMLIFGCTQLPFIIIDAAETSVEIPILQFPLWVAFAGSDNEIYDDLELN